ncbi:hypothetical protein B0H10DRAFT_1115965 [Mycena sp. CBHHK59/15]|nr:hypothetical protein B0H10DRAFT_1115965 [Mycena sp. CBHHK59/15]
MAKDPPLLESPTPAIRKSAAVHISHVQLRDVLICPRERGVVNYVQENAIVEHNLLSDRSPQILADLNYSPNTLTSLVIPGTDHTLLAAGGQDAEIHLSLLTLESDHVWQFNTRLQGPNISINNSILLTSLSLSESNESSVEPHMAVSNNDCTVKFFDIPVRSRPTSIVQVGSVPFNVPVNHSSISPDGRTLLTVGDSSKVLLHRLTGGAQITASPIAAVTLPATPFPALFSSPALAASFSTAFSADGSKFAVAAQEGVVAVWDVRSTRPLRVFHTDKGRSGASAWLSDDPAEWSRVGRARGPGWSARSVKFGGRPGRELMAFTEHTALVHVVDARTFETEEIVRVPAFPRHRERTLRARPQPARIPRRPARAPRPRDTRKRARTHTRTRRALCARSRTRSASRRAEWC